MMNEEAGRLGYEVMHFVEPAGISPDNVITAREYVDFCRRFILLHPDTLRRYFSVREFTYPMPENLAEGNREKPITQSNRNELLKRFPGADGLKTGFIDESGYNIAATAEREGMRLIAVILGVPADGPVSGPVLRTRESEALLSYGFDTFVTARPSFPAPGPVHVWKGRSHSVALTTRVAPLVVVPRDRVKELSAAVEQKSDVFAPVRPGQALGTLVVSVGGDVIARFPLVAETGIDRGGALRRAADSTALFFRALFGDPVRF
jgi:serine-type D-Ala-D-Ala carboxypeptidase (penicillin-binding protein 5/6)